VFHWRTLRRTGYSAPAARERLDTDPLSRPVTPLVNVRLQRISLIVVTVLAFVGAAWIASALWAGLLLGVLLAFAIEPAYRRLLAYFPRRRALAAGICTVLVALVGAGITTLVFALLASELADAVTSLRGDLKGVTPTRVLGPSAQRTLATIGITPEIIAERVAHLSDRAADYASGALSTLLGSTLSWLAGSLIAFVTAFYTLKERRPIERRLEQILPLHPQTTRELAREFRKVGRGTLIGCVLAGLVQGMIAAVGFALGGAPRPVLLGIATAIASFIPVVGTMLVWIPTGVGLLLAGHPVAGIFEILWGILITSSFVDYVLRPVLVGRESRSHPLLFLIGLIGGVEVFGGVGILAGPLAMAFFASVLRIYRREIVDPIRHQDLSAIEEDVVDETGSCARFGDRAR